MDLIPAPRQVSDDSGDEFFVLGPDTVLAAGPGTERAERWLRSELGAATGHRLAPGNGSETDAIRITVAEMVTDDLGPEGYRIMVSPTGVHLYGGGPAGVFWGAQTLRQLLGPDAFRRAPLEGREWRIPFCHIEDSPRFGWRGFMLDVARHFMPKDAVLRYLDLMAAHKLNVLHLHLTDDQGWRVEIKRYPLLTEVGAWRERTKVGLRESELWDERPHGGYYTQDDIREIVAYAAQRHITVVPEIDIPGHSQAAIAAYPELGNTDVVDTGALSVLTSWGVNPNVLAPADSTLRFYEGVFTELLDLFPSEFFHIGGDECPKEQWRASAAAQARIKELGLAGEDELQSWIIRHFDGWLAERGRRLIGWDEILEGGLAPGAAVSSWRGYEGGIAAARAGHDVVMCPESHVYLDWRQSDRADEPVPIARVRTLEDVYRFEPVPAELTEEQAAHVIGTQANAWTEVMDSPRVVDYMVFPRLAAVAEVAWSELPAPAERDWPDFERRMEVHYARLDALGVEYRPPGGPLPWQRRPGVLGRPIDGPPPIV
ncbi:beta-N-acetylhexosaminidase [Streptomyces sp. SID13666]|uniref:beta-N-acetylhexosaminidase n=1 Tax=unclassified Streptomyces TaxID=2593676 RepID=UPI001106C022|nr:MULTISPECIES: beta-N-acetylhexosaminidase [unclassified Streptomyces]NEA60492.1 beta-N-acetylhexosaminidase [Streptomyces sp. SID13666]NEA76967.1 beta-N-acetylhexosaminidase [Streptomyces sp. SID13588]QNA73642.1 beta-N-acetylhexosaminidase [Streptomyces sp. So13.3]